MVGSTQLYRSNSTLYTSSFKYASFQAVTNVVRCRKRLMGQNMSNLRTKSSKTMLPGFGRPVNYVPREGDPEYVSKLFHSALNPHEIDGGFLNFNMTALREFTMLQLMNTITDKADWHIKVNNPHIVRKWKDEALASGRDITQKMLNWCIEELRYKASLFPPSPSHPPPIVVYNGDIVKSDFAVSPELKTKLQQAAKSFEGKIPDDLKDWHPNSEKKVLDLVHPSLYPFVYGLTRVLSNGETATLEDCNARSGEGEIAPTPGHDETKVPVELDSPFDPFYAKGGYNGKDPFSAKFQWLPCEVDISGDEAKITSYINNIHPGEEKHLYDVISKLITASIPLWDLTLAPLHREGPFGFTFEHHQRISYTKALYDPDPHSWPLEEGPQPEPGEDKCAYWDRREQWYLDTQKVVLPDPDDTFHPLPLPPRYSLKDRYGKRGLQVIVKLANIELTPDKPEYEGGSWHIEGQMNEHIVTTALYYYSCSNITLSSLSFKQTCPTEPYDSIEYGQDQHDWLTKVFGLHQGGPGIQEVGDVQTREGRLLTFPNVLLHRVCPFKLEDPTKPGHRKIVALFLVDPNIKIISTANVPCQRRDWADAARSMQDDDQASLGCGSTPGFPITLEGAEALRLELIAERKHFVLEHESLLASTEFSLCEH